METNLTKWTILESFRRRTFLKKLLIVGQRLEQPGETAIEVPQIYVAGS